MAFPSNSTSHGSSIFLTTEEVEFLVGVKLGTVAWTACIYAQIGLLCWEYVNTLSLDLALLTGKLPIRPCGACFLAARISLLGCYVSHIPMLQTSRSLDCQILWIVILVLGATAINASSAILCFRACAIWSYRPVTTIPILLLWLVQLALWFLDIISLRLTQVNILIFGRTCFVTGMASMTAVPLCWTLVVDLSVSALIVGKLQSRQYKGTNLDRRYGSAKTTIGEIIASQMWLFTLIAIPSVATAAAVFWISKSSLIRLIPLGPTILCHVLLASRAFIKLHRVAEQLPDTRDESQIQNGEKLDIATMKLKITNVSVWTLPGASSSHPEEDTAPSSHASTDDVEIRGGHSSTGILRAPQRFNYSQRRGGTSSQTAARAALAGARSALMARQPTVVIKTEPSVLVPPRLEVGSSPARNSEVSEGVVVARRSIEPSSTSSSSSRMTRHLRAASTQQLPPSLKESPTLGTSESQAVDLADGYVSDLDSFGDSESDASVEEVIDSDCACDACRGKVQIGQSGVDPSASVDFGVLPEAAASEASSNSSLVLESPIAQAQTHIPSISGDTSVCACCLGHRPAQLHRVSAVVPPVNASFETCRRHRVWAPIPTLSATSTPSLSPSMASVHCPDQQMSSSTDLQVPRAPHAATVPMMARDHPYANASAFTDKQSTISVVNPSSIASRIQVQVGDNAMSAMLPQTPSTLSATSRRSRAKRAEKSPTLSDETFGNPWVSSGAPFMQSVHPSVPLHPPVTARGATSPSVEDLVRQAAYLVAPSHNSRTETSPSTLDAASQSLSSSSSRGARLAAAAHPAETDMSTRRGDADSISPSGLERARMYRSRAMSVDRLRTARKDGAEV